MCQECNNMGKEPSTWSAAHPTKHNEINRDLGIIAIIDDFSDQ